MNAERAAAVAAHAIAIVALFEERREDSIAASGILAEIGAGIRCNRIAIVTFLCQFKPIGLLDDSVAAACERADVGTYIRLHGVSVIAFLRSLCHHAVAAFRCGFHRTEGAAAITVLVIAIIACFTVIKRSVAASGQCFRDAGGGAAVAAHTIAIITIFVVLRIQHAVSARGQYAIHAATIGQEIMIQNSLIALFTRIHHGIAAARQFTGEAAGIGQEITPAVSGITLFPAIGDDVSASGQRAIGAAHIRARIVITDGIADRIGARTKIAFLICLPNAVAADERYLNLACGRATVTIDHVAIVALFIKFLLDSTVAAMRDFHMASG